MSAGREGRGRGGAGTQAAGCWAGRRHGGGARCCCAEPGQCGKNLPAGIRPGFSCLTSPPPLAAHAPRRRSKNALLYASYAFLIAAAAATALGVALNCPGLANPSLLLLLALLLLAWGGAWLITTGLKVGSDG